MKPNSSVVALDIGGTKIEIARILQTGEVQKRLRIPTPKQSNQFEKTVIELILKLATKQTIAVGFSIPGSIDPQTKKLRNAPNSPEINESHLLWNLQKHLPWPCVFENDANCLVISEHRFGVAQNKSNVLGLIMGTGFGGGVILNKKLLHSPRGLAAELGHMILNATGRTCLCGNLGCVEAYLSGPSILKRYLENGGDPTITNTEVLFKNIKTDSIAKDILNETQDLFMRLMASLVSLYDPDLIVLGGGLSNQSLYYGLENKISQFVFGAKHCPPIKKAKQGDSSGIFGATALAFELK